MVLSPIVWSLVEVAPGLPKVSASCTVICPRPPAARVSGGLVIATWLATAGLTTMVREVVELTPLESVLKPISIVSALS